MRVTIKQNQAIPEGYTYINCNHYTPEEFVRACSPAIKGCINQNALDYVRDHPRKTYDTEDLYRVRMMRPVLRSEGKRKKAERKNEKRPVRMMSDPARDGDMSIRRMAEYCGVGFGTFEHCVQHLGMPFRMRMDYEARRVIKYLRPAEVLEFVEQLPRRSEKHNIILRRLRQDLKEG